MGKRKDDELEAAAWLKAGEGRNDPDYQGSLEEKARRVDEVTPAINQVIVYDDGKKQRIELGMTRPSNRPQNMQAAENLGVLFEAPVTRVGAQQPEEQRDYTQKQASGGPAHKYFKGEVTVERKARKKIGSSGKRS